MALFYHKTTVPFNSANDYRAGVHVTSKVP